MKTLTVILICLIASTAFATVPDLICIMESKGQTIPLYFTPEAQPVQQKSEQVKTDSNLVKKIFKNMNVVDWATVFGVVPGLPH